MMIAVPPVRRDISDKLVHFTSGATEDAAFETLCTIVDERRLLGGTRNIRGGYRCVCFTEAPLPSLPGGLVNPSAYSRYQPFGVVVDKAWAFARGGRPVVYQSDEEFNLLPEALRWRHMRYEPDREQIIDFTWEREWRMRVDELPLDPAIAALVLPDQRWAHQLIDAHNEREEWRVYEYTQVLEVEIAEQLREGFPWRIFCLR